MTSKDKSFDPLAHGKDTEIHITSPSVSPTIYDHADGEEGHFAIGRYLPLGKYIEWWNDHEQKFGSQGTVYTEQTVHAKLDELKGKA